MKSIYQPNLSPEVSQFWVVRVEFFENGRKVVKLQDLHIVHDVHHCQRKSKIGGGNLGHYTYQHQYAAQDMAFGLATVSRQ
jgi:hypothetical protein